MPIVNHSLTTGYMASDIEIPDTTSEIELWAVDAVPATTEVACIVRLSDAHDNVAETPLAAGEHFVKRFEDNDAPSGWSYNIKAAVGTPVGVAMLS